MNNRSVQAVKRFLDERGWFDTAPANLAKSISIESAELLEHFQWSNPSAEEVRRDPEVLGKISKELADVLIYAFHMTSMLGLDVDAVVEDKLEHAGKKYPVDKVKGPAGSAVYKKLKQEYRDKGIN
ncbi:MAG: nucleotide pyrophosphohydrolase [Candidatus Paceibacterota bacterium]|jgi:NTP pyrophosphatase (non-canonical NTP hydrolase)